MTIAYRDRENASGDILSGNDLSVSLPGLTEDGDLLIAIVHRDAGGGDSGQTSYPTGWTKLDALCVWTDSGRDRVIDIGWKIADNETGPYLFTNNGASTQEMHCLILAYSGVDQTTPIDVTPTSSHYSFIENVLSTDLVPPPITPNTSPTMAVVFGTITNPTIQDTSATAPSGYTEAFGNNTSHDVREYCFICAAQKALSDTSTETPGYFNLSGWLTSDEGYTATIVLREAAAGQTFNRVLKENTVVTDPIPGYQLTQERPANSNVELLTDAAFVFYAYARLIQDDVTADDVYIMEKSLRRIRSQQAGNIIDAIEMVRRRIAELSDNVDVVDSLTKSITIGEISTTYSKVRTDALKVQDSLDAIFIGIYDKQFADTIALGEAEFLRRFINRSIPEQIAIITDLINMTRGRVKIDRLRITDALEKTITRLRTYDVSMFDAFALTDTYSKDLQKILRVELIDLIGVTDSKWFESGTTLQPSVEIETDIEER